VLGRATLQLETDEALFFFFFFFIIIIIIMIVKFTVTLGVHCLSPLIASFTQACRSRES
jgi:small basic protein